MIRAAYRVTIRSYHTGSAKPRAYLHLAFLQQPLVVDRIFLDMRVLK